MTTVNISTNLGSHPNFAPPTFGVIDFGTPTTGPFSVGYKMIAFEPGKILQAQELNEIQFRMNVHQTLTMQMTSNWLNEIIVFGTTDSFGPGWDGATPIKPNNILYNRLTDTLFFEKRQWYLCKANSNGLFFWLYLSATNEIFYDASAVSPNNYIGFTLNTTADGEYTGELVNCNTVGNINSQGAVTKHQLTLKNSSVCGSSRYYLRITGITESVNQITNEFVGIVQKRQDGYYYLNNIKVRETT
jgi:hypothetical protein